MLGPSVACHSALDCSASSGSRAARASTRLGDLLRSLVHPAQGLHHPVRGSPPMTPLDLLGGFAVFAIGGIAIAAHRRAWKRSSEFLAAVEARVGEPAARRLRGWRAPRYLVFSAVPELPFNTSPRRLELRRYPALSEYRAEPTRVLKQYAQDLRTSRRYIRAWIIVGTALYGALASTALEPLYNTLRAATTRLRFALDTSSTSEAVSAELQLLFLAFAALFALVVLPLALYSWGRRSARIRALHFEAVNSAISRQQLNPPAPPPTAASTKSHTRGLRPRLRRPPSSRRKGS